MYLQDECSFVSLRDVERVMNVMVWFYKHRTYLFESINERAEEFYAQQRRGEEDNAYRVLVNLYIPWQLFNVIEKYTVLLLNFYQMHKILYFLRLT